MFLQGDLINVSAYVDGRVHNVPIAPCIPKVIIEMINPDATMPKYAFDGDSGMDVYATEDVIVEPGDAEAIKLGFKLGIPKHPYHDYGYRWECQVRPRSGISAKTRMTVILGSVDNPYRGEVGVIVHNTNARGLGHLRDLNGNISDEPNKSWSAGYIIKKGERFAQLVFNEVIRPLELILGKVDETDRGEGGFGSTGV